MHYDFDGEQYVQMLETVYIVDFEGQKNISELPVVPLELNQAAEDLRRHYQRRGNYFISITDTKETVHRQYNGWTVGRRYEEVSVMRLRKFS